MISLETAKKLKSSGLKWEPKQYDFYQHIPERPWDEVLCLMTQKRVEGAARWAGYEWILWLPSLSRLLAEIEKRGRIWRAEIGGGWYGVAVGKSIDKFNHMDEQYMPTRDTPEEAAAAALIWILEQHTENA